MQIPNRKVEEIVRSLEGAQRVASGVSVFALQQHIDYLQRKLAEGKTDN